MTAMSMGVQTAACGSLTERYEALLRVSQTLISCRTLEELLSVLARELREVVEFFFLGVGIYDEELHKMRLECFDRSGAPIQVPKLRPEETISWWVYQHQHLLVIPTLDEESRFPVPVDFLKKLDIRSL